MGDGLAAQESNPEVEVDISRPDVQINEQIFALKLATNKLDAAYNGHTVEWPHYEPSEFHLRLSELCSSPALAVKEKENLQSFGTEWRCRVFVALQTRYEWSKHWPGAQLTRPKITYFAFSK